MSIVQVQELRKQYDPPKGVLAVDDVSFAIERGEIFSLLGPNGAGKSTTISMLSCLLRPTGGDALVDGHSVVERPAGGQVGHRRRAAGHRRVPRHERAREPACSGAACTGWPAPSSSSRVDEVLELISLVDRQNDRVDKFSGGMKRRVNIGVALLHRPKVLYLDEPTVGIDPQSRRSILDGILALRDQGMTLLYTTHYMAEAQELSDRIGIIDHGKMIALGTHEELVKIVGEESRVEVRVDHDLEGMVERWSEVRGVSKAFRRGRGPRRAARRRRQRGAAAALRGGGGGGLAHHRGRRARAQPRARVPAPHRPGAEGVMRGGRRATKILAIAWKDLRSTMRNVPRWS